MQEALKMFKQNSKKNLSCNENWLDIPNYEGYYKVSDCGRIKSLDRIINCKNGQTQRKPGIFPNFEIDKDGYYKLTLHKDGVQKKDFVHRWVAQTFLNNEKSKPVVNHKDGNKQNNHLKNLEWATFSENTKHAFDLGLCVMPSGSDNPNGKLTEKEVIHIRNLRKQGKTLKRISKEIDTSESNVKNIIYGYTWKWLKEGDLSNV